MTVERRLRDSDSVTFPGKQGLAVVADVELQVHQQTIRAYADVHSNDITVTLPNVTEACGKIYSILARDADNVNTVTIEDNNNDSEQWGGDYVLDAPQDFIMLYSDGLKWCVMCTNLTGQVEYTTLAVASDAPTTVAQ